MRVQAPVVPPWTLVVASMLSVQLGSALSVPLIATFGAAGTAWLRLTTGAVIVVVLVRPSRKCLRRSDIPMLLGLGLATGGTSIGVLAALERIPLGTAIAIGFLGPLAVVTAQSRKARALVWPASAVIGVGLLTQPWQPHLDVIGLMFGALAGTGWAAYILLTQRVGDRYAGVEGLALTIPIAALSAAAFGIPQARGSFTPTALAAAVGLGILVPVLPCVLEMVALRYMTHTAFGTLTAIEPAIGILVGIVILQQPMSGFQLVGMLLVVGAGAGAQYGGRRSPSTR